MVDLYKLKVGDFVQLRTSFCGTRSDILKTVTVKRVTATQIATSDGQRFLKNDGRRIPKTVFLSDPQTRIDTEAAGE